MNAEREWNHPGLIQILQENGRRPEVLLLAHLLVVIVQDWDYANEVLQRFIVLSAVKARGRVDVLLEEGNGGCMGDAVRLNDVEVVVSFDLSMKAKKRQCLCECESGELLLGFARDAIPDRLHSFAGRACIRVELDDDLIWE